MSTMVEVVHEQWAQVTNDGALDGSVADVEELFREFSRRLVGRYNPGGEAMASIEAARVAAIHAVKQRVVAFRPLGIGSRP